jgi:hypothetical protein
MVRDAWHVEAVQIRSAQDVVQLVNRLNKEGVAVYRRLSPPLLIEFMKSACDQSAAFHEALDPFAPAAFSVTWAGEQSSLNWFDTARELTERWHHQQQIRLATNRPGILLPELYHPVLDCFVRGLPHAYRNVQAPEGTQVQLHISGDCGGTWYLTKQPTNWELVKLPSPNITSKVIIPQDIAWRVFTKGIDRQSALEQSEIQGDRNLGQVVLDLTAIVG